jgi:hypothetical protein
MEEEVKEIKEEPIPQTKKVKNKPWLPLAILIGIVIIIGGVVVLISPRAGGPVNNNSNNIVIPPLNITIANQRIDVSQELCAQLNQAAAEANITSTKYYFQNPHCVWEIADYSQEFVVFCENENNTLNVKLRPRNMTIDVVKSRFPECNVTQTI